MINIGVDLGGTKIKIGLVAEGNLLATTEIIAEAGQSFAQKLPEIELAVNQLLKKINHNSGVLGGIGLSFPSIVDSEQMKILSEYVKFTDANKINLQEWARQTWHIPLVIENDARAALLGEWQFGAGQGIDNLVLVTLGTGMGSAVMMDGKLLKGKHFLAGNLGGHMTINFQGKNCNCGNRGCVESEGGTWALPELVKSDPLFSTSRLSGEPVIDFKAVFTLAAKGDELSLKISDHCMRAWAAGITNLIYAFDPELVIMGGGILKSKKLIIPFIQRKIDALAWIPAGSIKLLSAKHIQHAGILGMAYLASQSNN